jgi:hypothetical protein
VSLLRGSGGTAPDPVGGPATAGEQLATEQAMIGEEARDGQLVFVVDEFACQAKQAGAGAQPGKLCSLRFTAKNASGSPATLLGRFQYLVDGRSRTYGADEAMTLAVPENANRGISQLSVNPDVTVPLTFVFDIPDTVEPVEAQFKGTGRSRFGVSVRLERRA